MCPVHESILFMSREGITFFSKELRLTIIHTFWELIRPSSQQPGERKGGKNHLGCFPSPQRGHCNSAPVRDPTRWKKTHSDSGASLSVAQTRKEHPKRHCLSRLRSSAGRTRTRACQTDGQTKRMNLLHRLPLPLPPRCS